jgi:hypothetical protein
MAKTRRRLTSKTRLPRVDELAIRKLAYQLLSMQWVKKQRGSSSISRGFLEVPSLLMDSIWILPNCRYFFISLCPKCDFLEQMGCPALGVW